MSARALAPRRLRIQLWSYNYAPEPTGIGPVSAVWAGAMRDRGHLVEVVAAHPHYPRPAWGARRLPYRETREGIPVLRLPLWVGRDTGLQRMRQELSYAVSQAVAAGFVSTPDVLVAVSPSFPALLPAMLNARLRRRPWVLWLQDLLPDGALATGLVPPGPALEAARALEAAAYRSAARILVISAAFERSLLAKGVPPGKLERIVNPVSRAVTERVDVAAGDGTPRVLSMGNIGHSQGLADAVRAFESSARLAELGVRLVITGEGVAADDVRKAIASRRVEMRGLVSDEALEAELRGATFGLVTQRADVVEFNLPSKLMNFMAYGLPVIAFVRDGSEAARIVADSAAGWVADSARPDDLPRAISEALADPAELDRRGAAGHDFARRHFTAAGLAERTEEVLLRVIDAAHGTR